MTSNNFLNYEEGYGKIFHIPRTMVWDWQVVSVGWRIWAGKLDQWQNIMGFIFLSVLHTLRSTSPPDCCWSGCCSVAQLCPNLCDLMDCSIPGLPVLHYLQEFCSNLCPLSWWCHPTTSSSVTPFYSCPQSFPASVSFPVSWLFASGGQNIGASTSTSVLLMNIQCWFPLGLTSLISLQSKGLSRIFSSTTVQKHPFFSAQPSLWSSSHIHTWLLEKT